MTGVQTCALPIWRVSIPVPDKVRPNDKLYKLITVNEIKEIK